jgi:hypothetical protein
VWLRPGYRQAPLGPALLQVQRAALSDSQPAIEAAPAREAIVTPYAPPAAVTASLAPISPLPPVSDAEPAPIEETPEWLSRQQEPTGRSATATTSA